MKILNGCWKNNENILGAIFLLHPVDHSKLPINLLHYKL